MFPPISDGVVVSESIRSVLFELQKNTGKTYKSSVPVLSAGQLYFQLSTLLAVQGFSQFWPIALAFLHVHARACLHMLRRLVRCLGTW